MMTMMMMMMMTPRGAGVSRGLKLMSTSTNYQSSLPAKVEFSSANSEDTLTLTLFHSALISFTSNNPSPLCNS